MLRTSQCSGDPRLAEKSLMSPLAPRNAAASIIAVARFASRTGQRHGKLSAALAGAFLALRVGVGKESADRQQQNGAQPQSQPGSHQQSCRLSHRNRCHQHQKQRQAAPHAIRIAEQKTDDCKKREKSMDAHSRRPSNGPAELTSHAYILIVEGRT